MRDTRQKKGIDVARCFAVFDRDDHARYAAARQLAAQKCVELATSNPCIELWLIWLRRDQTAPLDRSAAQRACKTLHAKYDHDTHPYISSDALDDSSLRCAATRAEGQERRHVSAGDSVDSNPSSSFSRAVEALVSLAKRR